MKLVVTGGAGYIGSVVTSQLLDAGHAVMYEKPAEFISLVLGFVNNDTNVTLV